LKVSILVGTIGLILVAGFGLPAFAQTADPISTGDAAPSPRDAPVSSSSFQVNQACTLIDFEGVGNRNPVGTIGAAAFGNAEGIVDSDAGGTGNIANEPSPDTVMLPKTTFATVTLDNPVNEIRVFHSSFGPSELRVFNAANILLATFPLPQTPVGPGDPLGGLFGTWVQVIHSEPSAIIKKVEFDGATTNDRTAYDNFEFCITEDVVGGEFLPINSTSLLLASAQSFSWMIPVVLSGIGIGLFVVSRKSENS